MKTYNVLPRHSFARRYPQENRGSLIVCAHFYAVVLVAAAKKLLHVRVPGSTSNALISEAIQGLKGKLN